MEQVRRTEIHRAPLEPEGRSDVDDLHGFAAIEHFLNLGVRDIARWMGRNLDLVHGLHDTGTAGGLKNLSLYGHETAPAQAESVMMPKWNQMIRDITKYFGQPKSAYAKPQYAALGDEEITFTHVWPMKTGGSLLMGVGKLDGKYLIMGSGMEIMPGQRATTC